MSGFEVVGVVLGSIPILITALERCRDGVRPKSMILDTGADDYAGFDNGEYAILRD